MTWGSCVVVSFESTKVCPPIEAFKREREDPSSVSLDSMRERRPREKRDEKLTWFDPARSLLSVLINSIHLVSFSRSHGLSLWVQQEIRSPWPGWRS